MKQKINLYLYSEKQIYEGREYYLISNLTNTKVLLKETLIQYLKQGTLNCVNIKVENGNIVLNSYNSIPRDDKDLFLESLSRAYYKGSNYLDGLNIIFDKLLDINKEKIYFSVFKKEIKEIRTILNSFLSYIGDVKYKFLGKNYNSCVVSDEEIVENFVRVQNSLCKNIGKKRYERFLVYSHIDVKNNITLKSYLWFLDVIENLFGNENAKEYCDLIIESFRSLFLKIRLNFVGDFMYIGFCNNLLRGISESVDKNIPLNLNMMFSIEDRNAYLSKVAGRTEKEYKNQRDELKVSCRKLNKLMKKHSTQAINLLNSLNIDVLKSSVEKEENLRSIMEKQYKDTEKYYEKVFNLLMPKPKEEKIPILNILNLVSEIIKVEDKNIFNIVGISFNICSSLSTYFYKGLENMCKESMSKESEMLYNMFKDSPDFCKVVINYYLDFLRYWRGKEEIREKILYNLYSPIEIHPLIKMFTKDIQNYHRYGHIFSDMDESAQNIFQLSWLSAYGIIHYHMDKSILYNYNYYALVYWQVFLLYLKEKDEDNKILCKKYKSDIEDYKYDLDSTFHWDVYKELPFDLAGLIEITE